MSQLKKESPQKKRKRVYKVFKATCGDMERTCKILSMPQEEVEKLLGIRKKVS